MNILDFFLFYVKLVFPLIFLSEENHKYTPKKKLSKGFERIGKYYHLLFLFIRFSLKKGQLNYTRNVPLLLITTIDA